MPANHSITKVISPNLEIKSLVSNKAVSNHKCKNIMDIFKSKTCNINDVLKAPALNTQFWYNIEA